MLVAAGQAPCAALDIAANVATAAALVRRAAEAGAHILVLPELFLTGYELREIAADPETCALRAEDGRLEPLAIACAETRTAVVAGAPVRGAEASALHISALILGRDGRFAARYDKQHVDSDERAAGFSPGASGCTITLDGWRLGVAICWDASFPEHARAAALDGCHAYLIGAMFGGERGARKRAIIGPARALDNAMYVAAANHCGRSGPFTGCGGSAVWSPDGTALTDAGAADPGLAVARLNPELLARTRAQDWTPADPSLTVPVRPRRQVLLDWSSRQARGGKSSGALK
jgi:predicted amidohydrolase